MVLQLTQTILLICAVYLTMYILSSILQVYSTNRYILNVIALRIKLIIRRLKGEK